MRAAPLTLLLLPALLPAPRPWAVPAPDLVVIVNSASDIRSLTRNQVVDIFMGRFRQLPSGAPALPIDVDDSSERAAFYRQPAHRSLAEVGSYWARLVFSGQASPPFRASDNRAAVALVAENPDAIAYVDRASVTARARVVLDLGAP